MSAAQKQIAYIMYAAHVPDFCKGMKANVLFWAKMAYLSGMFIYPAVHLCGVHCIRVYLKVYKNKTTPVQKLGYLDDIRKIQF